MTIFIWSDSDGAGTVAASPFYQDAAAALRLFPQRIENSRITR
jgi:hypothetical protein